MNKIMLQILQTRNYDSYKDIIASLELTDVQPSVAEATENDIITGIGIYHFNDKNVCIDYVDSKEDLYLYDGIVRSILFLAYNKGFDRAVFMCKDEDRLKKLGFITDRQKSIDNIDKFLSTCKNCNKNK